jgi:hypothetical protein
VTLHGPGNYQQATHLLQTAGYHKRQKQIFDCDCGDPPWCSVSASDGDDFEIQAFANGLPPSCARGPEKEEA